MSTLTTASRVGRKPVTIPSGVNINIEGLVANIKGPKGSLKVNLHPSIEILQEADKLKVVQKGDNAAYCRSGSGKKLINSISGTVRAEINNAVYGVTKGFEEKLLLVGVGYRAQMKGNTLSLAIGYSHPVDFVAPEGIVIEAPSLTEIIIKGSSKHLVGHTASKIIEIRPEEPYKGKGIVRPGRRIARKETKKK